MHFSADPTSSGGVEFSDLDAWSANEAVTHTHNAGKKILISIGGWGSWSMFNRVIRYDSLRAVFIQSLIDFMNQYGYDGLDIDAEPINNAGRWQTFIRELRAAMPPGKLLTCAVMTEDVAVAAVHEEFDQINIMTYDMSGAWPGWVTWHNAPIYNGGKTFPSTDGPLPSADLFVDMLISAGVPKEKIGIGLDWYGYAWKGGAGTPTGGATAPYQEYTSDPNVEANIPYHDIKSRWPNVGEKWDASAQAAYLSIDATGSSNDFFVSFDNEQTGQAKIDYVRQKGLGGIIVWELGGGYQPGANPPDRLSRALKAAYGGGIPPDTTEPPIPEPEPCDTVFVEQPDSIAYWLGFRDGSALADTIFIPVIQYDTLFVTMHDTVFVSSGKDTVYIIPKRFEVIVQ